MADCYEGMRAALRRNIAGLAHLSADQKEALLESQMGMAIAASESGRPFVEIYGPEIAEADAGADEVGELPAPRVRNTQSKKRG